MPGAWFPGLAGFYDFLHHVWERPSTERRLGFALLWIYLFALAAVQLKRMGLYPLWLPAPMPSHFYAIELAFTLILGIEVISLIFVLPTSLSSSMAKQFEILTLILLRNAFKELSLLPEPVYIDMDNVMQIVEIAVSGSAALLVFIGLGIFRRCHRRWPLMLDEDGLRRYIMSKKLVALVLLGIFIGIGAYYIWLAFMGEEVHFFETIYTVLIFADIAMVLIAQRYMPCYFAVFRNSGFVVGTLLMRLSLSAPHLLCGAIAVFAAIFVLALNYGVNMFGPALEE